MNFFYHHSKFILFVRNYLLFLFFSSNFFFHFLFRIVTPFSILKLNLHFVCGKNFAMLTIDSREDYFLTNSSILSGRKRKKRNARKRAWRVKSKTNLSCDKSIEGQNRQNDWRNVEIKRNTPREQAKMWCYRKRKQTFNPQKEA